jgi:TolC family type I secretion outer membrane protein
MTFTKHSILFPVALAVVIIMTCFPDNGNALSLNEALVHAYEQSYRLKSEYEKVKFANENSSQALSEWLPNVQGEYSRGTREIKFGGVSTDGDTDSRTLRLSQPIFNGGGSVARKRQANHQINAAEARLLDVEQSVLIDAVIAYLDVVRDTELLEISRHNEQVLAEHLAANKQRFKLGEITKTDSSQSESRYQLSISRVTLAQGQLASSRAAYKRAIGQEAVSSSIPEQTPSLPSLKIGTLIEQAQSSHPRIIALEEDVMEAKKEESIQKSRILPNVSFNAAHVEEDGVFAFSPGSTASETRTYTVDVAIPLFQSGAEYSRVRQAKHTTRSLSETLHYERDLIGEEVIRVFHELQSNQAAITSTAHAVEAAVIALDGVKKEANAGTRTTLDVLDAEQELFEVKQELITAKRDSLVSAYQLLASIGTLNTDTLGLTVNQTFDKDNYRDKNRFKIIGF